MPPAHGEPADDLPWQLLARHLTGVASAVEEDELRRWVGTDPGRVAVVAEARRAWEMTGRLQEQHDTDAGWARVNARLQERVEDERPAQGAMIRRAEWPGRVWISPARAPWRWAAAALVVIGGALTWRRADRSAGFNTGAPPASRSIATANGERAQITLADGTGVALAAASTLRYAPHFGDGRRDVYLDGEAYFQVRHDAARPFVVHTAGAITEDLGTVFSVRQYTDERVTEVVVGEGRVLLQGRGGPGGGVTESLAAGELGAVVRGAAPTKTRVDAAQYLAWTDGWLTFGNTTVAAVAAELARWYDLDVVVADPGLAARHLVASFRARTADEALHIVATALDVRVERHDRRVVISAREGRA
jgi:transmembrane sensor